MKQSLKHLLALILALAMCLSLFCVSTWAGEAPSDTSGSEDGTISVQSVEEDSSSCEEASETSGTDDCNPDEEVSIGESAPAEDSVPAEQQEETTDSTYGIQAHSALEPQDSSESQTPIKLSDSTVMMLTDTTFTLNVTEGNDGEAVSWSSSSDNIAVISPDGVITPKKSGKCVITATIGETTAKCTVYVFSFQNQCGKNVYWFFDSSDSRLLLMGSGETYSYTSSSKVPWINQKAKIKKITVGHGITQLGKRIFADTTNLTEAILPSTLTLFDKYAFSGCKKLNNLFLIGDINFKYYTKTSFKDCRPREYYTYTRTTTDKFASMVGTWDGINTKTAKLILNQCGKNAYWEYVPSSRTLTISGKGPMYNFDYVQCDCPWRNFEEEIKIINIKKGITTIGELAFCDTMLEKGSKITIPNTVTSIGKAAFNGTGPVTIDIPGSVKTLGAYVFTLSEARTKIHEGLEVIKSGNCVGAFSKSVVFPSTLKSLGDNNIAAGVKTVTFKGNAPKISSKAFAFDNEHNIPMKLTVYYPKGNKTWKSVIKKQYGGKIKWKAKKM